MKLFIRVENGMPTLFDELGNCLPGQVGCSYDSGDDNNDPTLTMTFQIDGKKVVFEDHHPEAHQSKH